MADERFLKSDRLRKRAEFLAIQERGLKGHAGRFLVFVGPTPARSSSSPRLGVTVTKKIGGAVVRNRIKRIVREVFRREKDAFPRGMDVVVVAKQGSGELAFDAVREMLVPHLRRLGSSWRRASEDPDPPRVEPGDNDRGDG